MRQSLLFLILLIVVPASHAADVLDLSRLPDSAVTDDRAGKVEKLPLGKELQRGVETEAWLELLPKDNLHGDMITDIPTHRLRVRFVELKTKSLIEDGLVAARIFYEGRRKPRTLQMLCEEGVWSVDIRLPGNAETLIKLGSKLEDGKKRIYRFFYRPGGLTRVTERGFGPPCNSVRG